MTNKMPNELTTLAKRIAEYRQKHGLTYQEVGEATGVDKSHIYRIETMATFPSLKFLVRLAEFMEVPLFYLFLPSEQMNQNALVEELLSFCQESGKTLEDLEAVTGISSFRLQDFEDGTSSPTLKERQTLMAVLGMSDAVDSVQRKINFLKNILIDLQLKEPQIDKLLTYIQHEID